MATRRCILPFIYALSRFSVRRWRCAFSEIVIIIISEMGKEMLGDQRCVQQYQGKMMGRVR